MESERTFAEALLHAQFGDTVIEQYADAPEWASWQAMWLEHVEPEKGSSGWRMRYAFFAEHADAEKFAGLMTEASRSRCVRVSNVEDEKQRRRDWRMSDPDAAANRRSYEIDTCAPGFVAVL